MDLVTLNNGIKMPMVGFGTYQMPSKITARCVLEAISAAIAQSIPLNVITMNEKLARRFENPA